MVVYCIQKVICSFILTMNRAQHYHTTILVPRTWMTEKMGGGGNLRRTITGLIESRLLQMFLQQIRVRTIG